MTMTLLVSPFLAAGIPLWAKFLNFTIYAALLAWLLAKPITEGLRKRAQNIRDALDQAGQERRLAETKLRELEERFARLESELAAIRQQAEQEAQAEYQRIVAAAEADAARFRRLARMEIEGASPIGAGAGTASLCCVKGRGAGRGADSAGVIGSGPGAACGKLCRPARKTACLMGRMWY
jgi:F-type H+-transporting ATPase subunit b